MRKLMTLAAAVALVAACSGTTVTIEPDHVDETTTTTEVVADGVVSVTLSEFAITPFDAVDGEEITLSVTNDGAVQHELRLLMPGDVEAHEHDEHGDMDDAIVLILEPGETGTLTFIYDAMYFQAACLLPGHYEAGMFITLSEGAPMDMEMDHDEEADEAHDDSVDVTDGVSADELLELQGPLLLMAAIAYEFSDNGYDDALIDAFATDYFDMVMVMGATPSVNKQVIEEMAYVYMGLDGDITDVDGFPIPYGTSDFLYEVGELLLEWVGVDDAHSDDDGHHDG